MKKAILAIVIITVSTIASVIISRWLGLPPNESAGLIVFSLAFSLISVLNLPKKIGMTIATINLFALAFSMSLLITLSIVTIIPYLLLFIVGSVVGIRYFNDFYEENVSIPSKNNGQTS